MLQSLHTRLSSGISSHSCVVESTRVLEKGREKKRKEIIREERMKSREVEREKSILVLWKAYLI